MADDEIRDKEPADDLDPAFDSIDATMKDGSRKAVTVTPEALAQIVNDAVAKAITAYEESRGSTPEPGDTPQPSPGVQVTARRSKIEQLKDDLGLDEIQFDGPRPEPVEKVIARELSSQMGVRDFEFEDAPGPAAEPDAPTRTEADAIAGWATRADAIAEWVTPPVQNAAPPATPEVDETPAPAAAEEKIDDAEAGFDWVAAEFKRLEPDETPTALDLEPPWNQTPKSELNPVVEPLPVIDEPLPAIDEPLPAIDEPLPAIDEPPAPAIEEPPTAPDPEVRETLSSLASWFRSALGDKSPQREPAASVAVPEPEAPVTPAAPAAPEPPVAPPPPIVARHEEPSRPARDPAAASKPMTPEEAAKTVFFTFDPILPVPPRLPREPEEPPKKINKSGTFL